MKNNIVNKYKELFKSDVPEESKPEEHEEEIPEPRKPYEYKPPDSEELFRSFRHVAAAVIDTI